MLVDGGITGAGDSPRGLPATLVQHVADRHLGAGFDHQPSGRRTDAACGTRDEGYLAIETVHLFPPGSHDP
jgi:hypothetical protein